MYLSHFQLKHEPFQISTNPKFLWLGEKHEEALATLEYGVLENKGFLLLTGDVGAGKTTLIHALLHKLDKNTFAAFIRDPALDPLDFFQYAAHAFGMKGSTIDSKGSFLIQFEQFLLNAYESRRKVLLIIDEAQRMSQDLLEEVRLLSNIEREDSKLLNIFFVGQIEVNNLLTLESNRAIRQRISLNYNIEPFTERETRQYIEHRLKIASSDETVGFFAPMEKGSNGRITNKGYRLPLPRVEQKKIFSDDALREIFAFSQGFPRLINIICDRALLTGFVENASLISARHVVECSKELEIHPKKSTEPQAGDVSLRPEKKPADQDEENSFLLGKNRGRAAPVGQIGSAFRHQTFSGWEVSEKSSPRSTRRVNKAAFPEKRWGDKDVPQPAMQGFSRSEHRPEKAEPVMGDGQEENEPQLELSAKDIVDELTRLEEYADERVASRSGRIPVKPENGKKAGKSGLRFVKRLVAVGVVAALAIGGGWLYLHGHLPGIDRMLGAASSLWEEVRKEKDTLPGSAGPTAASDWESGGETAGVTPAPAPMEPEDMGNLSSGSAGSAPWKRVVSFQQGEFLPSQDSLTALNRLAESLSDYPSYAISIVYFISQRQSRELASLQDTQANVVKSYLMGRGIDESRIAVQRITKGEENGDEGGGIQNLQRMEVRVTL